MVGKRILTFALMIAAFLWEGSSLRVVAQTASTSCAQIVRAAHQAGAGGDQIEQAMELLQELVVNKGLQMVEYAKVGKELLNVHDPLASPGLTPNAADWIAIPVNGINRSVLSEDELVETIDSLSQYLRSSSNGALLGVETQTRPGQSPLIKNLAGSGDRTQFFRATGPRSLVVNGVQIQGRTVTPALFQAVGVLVATTASDGVTNLLILGDLAISGGPASSDFVIFKAANASFTESEIQAAFQSVLNQAQGQMGSTTATVNSITFVVESSVNLTNLVTSDSGVSVQGEISQLNSSLPTNLRGKLSITQTPF